MAITKNLAIGNLSPDAVFDILQNKGLSATEATSFIGTWLLSTIGQAKRTFNYVQDFADTDPNCVSKFARSFAHQDWQDGVSVVQASETSGELGFNSRFHLIEKDVDSLATNLAMAFTCLATMRQQLFNLLAEIRVEINRIDTDLDNCCNRRTAPPPPIGPLTQGSFLGFTRLNNVQMQIWQTNTGMIMVPDIAVVQGQAWNNPRASRAGQLARFVSENPEVAQKFPQTVGVQAFLDAFGARQLPDGTFVRDLVGSLPAAASYANLSALVTDVSDREAAALRTTEGARQAIAVSLGLSGPDVNIANARLDAFGGLAPTARAALLKNGVDTIGKFAQLPPDRAAEILKGAGVSTVTIGDLAEAANVAATLAKLG
jgi:hypothetical protein